MNTNIFSLIIEMIYFDSASIDDFFTSKNQGIYASVFPASWAAISSHFFPKKVPKNSPLRLLLLKLVL